MRKYCKILIIMLITLFAIMNVSNAEETTLDGEEGEEIRKCNYRYAK